MAINAVVKQNLNFAKVSFAQQSNPIVLKNQVPQAALQGTIKTLTDVVFDNPINNSVLIYNSTDENFHLDQLQLDCGTF
jgi:hypothetical protein